MNDILTEKDYQKFIINYLSEHNGYEIRAAENFDEPFACDRELLFRFLNETQSKEMLALRKLLGADLERSIISTIKSECGKPGKSLVSLFVDGIEIKNHKLELMYTKPATDFNKDLLAKYEKNIFSVMEEVWASGRERIDLVIFLNGLAIMSFELKCEFAGQDFKNAISQYASDRNPQTPLFLFKSGVFVNFAMDLDNVYMATKLDGKNTKFLPFNMGSGEGVNCGAGNPRFKDKHSVSYMWEDVLTKNTILDLISKFIFLESKSIGDEATGKEKVSENIIFPRYHQLDVIRKILADVRVNKSSKNYLILHSAGSGKTNSIAWLAYRLTSLHDADNKIIFDNVVIVTDRVVVDRQLQDAISVLKHDVGFIRPMDENCTSADLAKALEGNTKIVATTIQKFPYIVGSVCNMKNKHFAVIIDEAHSSTSGKDMAAVTKSLGSGEQADDKELAEDDIEDFIEKEVRNSGKQPNVSMFAFTATPKSSTLQLFGRQNSAGQWEAFHLYSMKQAIEEHFILDVLTNYWTYETFYNLHKEIAEDPSCKTSDANRQIARIVDLNDENISQRVRIIVEHFREFVSAESPAAKAMVVTSSRQAAVKYYKSLKNYAEQMGYHDINVLVAFSGKVNLPDDKTDYTETGLNGFPEDRLPAEFDKGKYNILVVANKYQTGFDQPKLCAMYVLKKLRDIAAVQTLSRLNRICPSFEKTTYILDFANTYEDIKNAFAPYYTTTLLSDSVKLSDIYDVKAQIEAFGVLNPEHVDRANELLEKGRANRKPEENSYLEYYLKCAVDSVKKLEQNEQKRVEELMRKFVRLYEFLSQKEPIEDVDLLKKYKFICYLLPLINTKQPIVRVDLTDKIKATDFVQKKSEEHKKSNLVADPIISVSVADSSSRKDPKMERLSQIIERINSRMGKSYKTDAVLKIREKLMASNDLKPVAKNNRLEDFKIKYYECIDDLLVKDISSVDDSTDKDFASFMLDDKNEKEKKAVWEIFAEDVYNALRNGQE